MEELLSQLEAYRQEIATYPITNAQQLEEYRIKYLGTKGIVKGLFGEMKNVPADKRKEFGQVLNDFKQFAEEKFNTAKEATATDKPSATNVLDLSLPGSPVPFGTRHPINTVRKRIIDIFNRLGFAVVGIIITC